MRFADTTRGRPFAKDPAVVRFQNRYLLYYSIPPFGDGRIGDGWGIGIAESDDLHTWRRCGELTPGAEYEARGLAAPGAIVHDGRVHLFYQTYGNGRNDAICHAVSDDGLRFTRNPSNPIFRPTGAWNCGRAIDADVILHDGQAFLYYATRDPEMRVQMLGVATAPIDGGFDRGSWVQRGEGPILAPELPWEQECIEAPAVCRRAGRFVMFYGGAYNNKPQQIGCAQSADGITWRRSANEPWLPNGAPGEWNASESGHPFIFTDDDGRTYLFFQGNDDHGRTWYLSHIPVAWDGAIPLRPPRDATR